MQLKHLANINNPTDTKKLSVEELEELAVEVRHEIVSAVSQTGGHLASNLGAVELTIALHYIFDLPRDKIVWDVSHQTYAHKLLTGRRGQMNTMRQYGGLAGFSSPEESEYDHFRAGHASTSISAALGFAVARDHAGEDHRVVALIGDGAMTGGLAFEGMNNAGSLKKDLIVVLNDNTWSISKNVGSISKYLTNVMVDEKMRKLRDEIWDLTGRFKRRDKIRSTIQRLEKSLKGLIVPGMLFENLGFRYFGPINGHDLPTLVRTLDQIKDIKVPVLLHVATVKGKGYEPAENDAGKFHGVGKFDATTGKTASSSNNFPSYTAVYGKSICELAEKDKRVVAITAAMTDGTGLVEYSERFPDRFYDVGIAEGHAATFAAAMASDGLRPYLTVYSTFMQRAYDQVIHDMAIEKLPVVICMDRGGLVGNDGPTHHGVFDLSYLAPIPNITICAPRDGDELRAMMHHCVQLEKPGVVAIRYPRGTAPRRLSDDVRPIKWGEWEELTESSENIILAVGSMVERAMKAAAILAEVDIDLQVVSARFVKPFDLIKLERYRKHATCIITAEENQLRGGFGQAVGDYLLQNEYHGKFKSLGIPDRFVTHGDMNDLIGELGLTGEKIAKTIRPLLTPVRKNGLLQKFTFRKNGHDRRKEAEIAPVASAEIKSE
ncbi:MAG: 1-deoxy-D-xylulose-5-phosphate synthase [candidate division Zixibacteria bacterium]